MKPIFRRAMGLSLIVLCGIGWAALTSLSRRNLAEKTCQGRESMEVIVKDSAERRFVTKEDVGRWIDREYKACAGLPLDSVNLSRIEEIVSRHSAVRDCEAWLTDDGRLHVQLYQRQPVVRFQEKTNGYYADEEGFIFPLQSKGSAVVPVVDGNIPLKVSRGFKGEPADEGQKAWLKSIIGLVNAMRGTPWEDDISQIHVVDKGNITMYPREGKEVFLFGQPVRVQEKLSLMEQYYRSIAPLKDAGYYSTVDVRYHGQIVCRK